MAVLFPQLGGNLIYPTIFFFKTFSRFSCLFQINNVPLLSKINNFEMEIIYSVKDMGGYLMPILQRS